MRILLASAALTVLALVNCAQTPSGCNGKRNDMPVLDLPANTLKTVANGQSWLMDDGGSNILYIAKVSGTAYEMGRAYGELFKEELQTQIKYGDRMYPSIMHDILDDYGVPQFVLDVLTEDQLLTLAEIALDINFKVALPYIPDRFVLEMKGIADGSGIELNEIIRLNLLPELTQAHCTVVGAWEPATKDNRLLHLRALDWDAFAPINQYPLIVLYEPSEPGSIPFANIGYLGLIGTLTGMSKIGITVGEKVMIVNNPDSYPEVPQFTYQGKPWMFVLRDTLQFAKSMREVQYSLLSARRTMKIHGGWSSLPDNTFLGMDYAANFVSFYSDTNYTMYNPYSHPQLDGIFFLDKHSQPSGDPCLPNTLSASYGHITPETLYRDVVGFSQTGDNKWTVMDPASQELWTAWSQYDAQVNAFERSPIHVRLNDFWTEKANNQDE